MKHKLPVCIAASAVVLVSVAAGLPAASAAPGSPGVPSAPTTVYDEGFGTGLSLGDVVALQDYDTHNYSADAPWLLQTAGNGLVADGTTTDADFTAAGYTDASGTANMRALATKIGDLNGSSPANSNHAVTAYTANNPGANAIEFKTLTPYALHAAGRFLTLSANVGVTNCYTNHPILDFYLVDGSTEISATPKGLDPCPAGAGRGVFASHLVGDGVLFPGADVGVTMRNETGTGAGNDHAFDDITILDVTPQLDKKFTDDGTTLKVGKTTTLTFTVTNTSELGDKTGWKFTDKLPKGLTVSGASTNNCAAATVTAATGAKSIKVTGGSLAAGQVSCEIKVPVKSTTGGTFKNSASNITSVGLNAPGSTTVKYVAPADPEAPATGLQHKSEAPAILAIILGGTLLAGLGIVGVRRRRA